MLFLGLAQSADKQIYKETHTRVFGSHKYHGFPILDTKAKGGVAGGFAILCGLMIFACVVIVKEEMDKHKDYSLKLI